MQQKPKTTVKAKVKVKAKPKPTKATNKALRKEVIGKLKEKVVQTNAAPKMGMGSKGMPKMKSGTGCMPKMAKGSSCVSGKYPDGTKKVKPTTKKTETPKQYAERKAIKPLNVAPLGARLVDGTPKPLPSGAVSARQRAAGQQTARQRAKIDKLRANLNAGIDNLERRAAQSKANQNVPITMPSSKNGTERTNTTKGNFNTRSGNGNGRVKGVTDQSCKRASDAAEATFKKAKGSSGIKTGKYPDGTKKVKETASQYEERKAMKPLSLDSRTETMQTRPKAVNTEALTDKKMKDYIANQAHIGKMGIMSLKNRQQPAKRNKNQKYGANNKKVTKLMGDGSIFSAPSGFVPAMKFGTKKVKC
jgi:hypothetical protein